MDIFATLLSNLNYVTIFILMLLESTVIPVPSELVVAPACISCRKWKPACLPRHLVCHAGRRCRRNHQLSGRLLPRTAHHLPLCQQPHRPPLPAQSKKVEKSEAYFNDHGMVATITGRLIPGIRHLISIPAGLAKMTYWRFLLYTTIGAGCWNCILAALGWYLHSFVPEDQLNDTIMKYGEYIKVIIMSIVAVALLYFIVKWLINRHRKIKFGNKD